MKIVVLNDLSRQKCGFQTETTKKFQKLLPASPVSTEIQPFFLYRHPIKTRTGTTCLSKNLKKNKKKITF